MDSPASTLVEVIDAMQLEPDVGEDAQKCWHDEDYHTHAELIAQIRFERQADLHATGHAYHQLFDDLWLYAWPVVKGFLRTNQFPRLLEELSTYRPVSIRPEDMVVLANSAEERDALAIDIISAAVTAFDQHVIERNAWDPAGGASLRTWFIGACVMQFPRVYRRWSKMRYRSLREIAAVNDLDMYTLHIPDPGLDPGATVVIRSELRAMVERAQPTTKLILGLLMQGKTYSEIASELRMSARSVEGRIYRLRHKVARTRFKPRPAQEDPAQGVES